MPPPSIPAPGLTAPAPPEARLPRAPAGTALYVHVPFCVVKCPYCDFFSVEAEGQDLAGTVGALLHEARARAPQAPKTVFIGGGTPSLLPEPQLVKLFDGLDEWTGFRSSAVEVTAECNPESLDRDKARLLAQLGVTRLSVGVQSLNPDTLKFLGRAHGPEDALRALEAARETDADVGADMIYACPGQSVEDWEDELSRVLEFEPQHLSAYNLTIEEGTLFHVQRERGELTTAPEEVELACFERTREIAEAAGLGRYEISNYARPGHECLHNLTYWANGAYVGLGPGAVSKVDLARAGNPRSLAPYLRWVESDEHATLWREQLDPLHRLGETWWLGLRRSAGVHPGEALLAAGIDGGVHDPAPSLAQELEQQGLMEAVGGRWRLTDRGWPLADGVARKFLALGNQP